MILKLHIWNILEQKYVHRDYEGHVNNNLQETEAYLEPSRTSVMEYFDENS